ncbi:amylo-alpha-1,6-glucosidase [Cytophagaceae bacterium ABcell3]|nr:amylo-alpha-1,6-glucosidase [Cytophagaceae bacterium ABcell3]
MTIEIDKHVIQDFEKSSLIEWLETNGLGGFMSSSITLNNTRSYHGLFTVATKPPVERTVLLSKIDEFISFGGKKYDLNVNLFSGKLCDEGTQYLYKFKKDIFPEFYYRIDNFEIKKTIAFIYGTNTAVVTYELHNAPKDLEFDLKPYVACRDYHSLVRANDHIDKHPVVGNDTLMMKGYQGCPPTYVQLKNAYFRFDPRWLVDFEYSQEKDRGMQYNEDLFSYGNFLYKTDGKDKFCIIISTEEPQGLDGFELIEKEKKRRLGLLDKMPVRDSLADTLALAADQFLVKRGTDLMTIMAGYHWFSDWGRDTMISLPGLCLVTGRHDDAKKILKAFASFVNKGMIPNRFPDSGEEPEYNTVDATLWFFVAIKKYLDYTGDKDFVYNDLLPVLKDVVQYHENGTRYNIYVDKDGLLYAGEDGVQLTWMDAKIGGWVVTPRIGKAVEINALWYNALKILEELTLGNGEYEEAKVFEEKAHKVKNAFLDTFVSDEIPYLYDYVNGEEKDKSLRPNQIFAFSLPYTLLEDDHANQILTIVEEHLLTPLGLRSLSPEDIQYKGLYTGDLLARDGAYHQGTVWSWLLGPYMTAKVRLQGEEGKEYVKDLLKVFAAHLSDAGVGNVSEIFDGEYPYQPKGCIAQAWGVAEVLRAYIEDVKPEQG